jgi:antitoxin CcdA
VLGAKIRQAREHAGLSQHDLAMRLDCTAGAVGQWELGMTQPGKDKLVKLAGILALSIEELVGWPGRTPASVAPEPVGFGDPAVRTGVAAINLDAGLLAQARRLGIDVPAALGGHLKMLIAKAQGERWLEENREAIADANSFLERHGLWSDGKRLF